MSAGLTGKMLEQGLCRRAILRLKIIARRWTLWLPYFTICVLSFVIALINVQGNYSIHFIDTAWPPNPNAAIAEMFSAWSVQNLGGVNVLQITLIPEYLWIAGLNEIGLPVGAQEVLTIGLFQTIAGVYAFRLFRDYIIPRDLSKFAVPIALAAGIIAVVNYAAMVVLWWDGIVAGFIFMAGTTALVFYVTRIWHEFSLNRRIDCWAIVLALVAGTVSTSVGVPFVVSSLILVFAIPPLVLMDSSTPRVAWVKFAFLEMVSVGIVVIASLWLLFVSYLESALVPSALGAASSTNFSLGVLNQTAGMSPLVVFRGLWGSYYPPSMFPGGVYGQGNILVYYSLGFLGSWLIVVCLILALLCSHRNRSRLFYSTAVVTVLGLFYLGQSSPAYPILIAPFLGSSLYLLIIRNPMVSLGYALIEFSVIVSTLAACQLIRHVQETARGVAPEVPLRRRRPNIQMGRRAKSMVAVSLVIVIVMVLPYSSAVTPIYSGHAIPQSPYQARADIPEYEFQIASYLNTHLNGTSVLLFPGGFLEQNWSHGYDAYDILPQLLPQSSIVYQTTNQYAGVNNDLVRETYTLIASGQTCDFQFVGLLGRLNIQYIVIEGDVGGAFPFGNTVQPNYPLILSSLNDTKGVSLVATFGPDYLYKTTSSQIGEIRPVTYPVNSASLIDSQDALNWNITSSYYNLTQMEFQNTTVSDTFAIWNSGLEILLNNSTRYYAYNHPLPTNLQQVLGGSPTVFNEVPLGLNSSRYPLLALTFTTTDSAIRLVVATTPDLQNLSSQSLQANFLPIGGAADNLGVGDPQLIPSYGAGYFTSPGNATTLTIDLPTLLANDANKTVDYLFISVFPVAPNGTGLRGVPLLDWPGNQTVLFQSIYTGFNYYVPPSWNGSTEPLMTVTVRSESLLNPYYNSSRNNLTGQVSQSAFPIWNSGLEILLNNSTRYYAYNHPLPTNLQQVLGGSPTVFNEVPLGLNSSRYPLLALTFTTTDSAIRLVVATTPDLQNLSSQSLQANFLPIGGAADNLGVGDPQLIPSYGVGYFTSPGNATTLTIDLPTLLANDANKTVDYLFISVFPVAPNGTGLRGVPLLDWPGNQTVVFPAFGASNLLFQDRVPSGVANGSVYSLWQSARVSWTPAYGGSVVADTSCNGGAGSTASYTWESSTALDVVLTGIHSQSDCVILEFVQNFAPQWDIRGLVGVTTWSHVLVDGFANGFLLEYKMGTASIGVTIYYSGQGTFVLGLAITTGILATAVVAVIVVALWRRFFVAPSRSHLKPPT